MTRIRWARILMSFVLIGSSVLSFITDWRSNHLKNPSWPPHARFHGAILLFLLAGVSIMGTWLLWRRTSEPSLPFKIAFIISISYWTPFFYVPFLLPSSSWWAGIPGTEPRIHGMMFYPNLVVAGIAVALAGFAYFLSHRNSVKEPGPRSS